MRIIFLIIIFLITGFGFSQTLERQTMTSSGSTQSAGGFELSYSFGQGSNVTTLGATQTILTQGFQQWVFDCELQGVTISNDTLICYGDTLQLLATGGHVYEWINTPALSDTGIANPKVYPKIASTYQVTITDTITGCSTIRTVNIAVEGAAIINGTAKLGTGALVYKGYAKLLRKVNQKVMLPVIDSVALTPQGMYTFGVVPGGDYYIRIHPDASIFPKTIPTYFGNAISWPQASVIDVACSQIYTANVTMVNLAQTPTLIGTGTLAGNVRWVTGFGKNEKTLGDPIPEVDIILEQVPGGVAVNKDKTDKEGKYGFYGVPYGDYQLRVEIPGIPMSSQTHQVSVTGDDSVFTQLHFRVDSFISIDDTNFIDTGTVINYNTELSIFPNPSKGQTNIVYTLEDNALVDLSVYDMVGRKVVHLDKGEKPEGRYKYTFSAASFGYLPGVYIVRLIVGEEVIVKHIIEEQ